MTFPPLTYGRRKKWSDGPGPARLVEDRGWWVGPVGKGLDVAEVHCSASQDAGTQEGYARLFAAAPELLAACEKVLGWIEDGQPSTTRNIIHDLEQAIRKAKGGAE